MNDTEFDFRTLSPALKKKYVGRGVIGAVAARTGVSGATVSRTFNGKFDKPNPMLIRELLIEMARVEEEDRETAPSIRRMLERAIA